MNDATLLTHGLRQRLVHNGQERTDERLVNNCVRAGRTRNLSTILRAPRRGGLQGSDPDWRLGSIRHGNPTEITRGIKIFQHRASLDMWELAKQGFTGTYLGCRSDSASNPHSLAKLSIGRLKKNLCSKDRTGHVPFDVFFNYRKTICLLLYFSMQDAAIRFFACFKLIRMMVDTASGLSSIALYSELAA
jgi:hypothetical protein